MNLAGNDQKIKEQKEATQRKKNEEEKQKQKCVINETEQGKKGRKTRMLLNEKIKREIKEREKKKENGASVQ